jgi:hypothetical protein
MNNRVADTRKVEVVKVQRPVIEVGGPHPTPYLIYAQGRRHLVQVGAAALPGWLVLALDKAPKVYARASWDGAAWVFIGVKQAVGQAW